MALAYKCDRCKNYFEVVRTDERINKMKTYLGTISTNHNIVPIGEKYYDLCPDCAKKLESFLDAIFDVDDKSYIPNVIYNNMKAKNNQGEE